MTASETEQDGYLTARLYPIAARFRAALERVHREWETLVVDANDKPPRVRGLFGMMQYFPKGCCDKTTLLLARYLHKEGFAEARSVYGSHKTEKMCSHEWVEVGDVIIDITADQFERFRPRPAPVIVTVDHALHGQFSVHGELHYTNGWAAWNYDAENVAAAKWMYQTVKRLADEGVEGNP